MGDGRRAGERAGGAAARGRGGAEAAVLGKDGLRRRMRRVRALQPAADRAREDAGIARRLARIPAYREADAVFAYLSFGAEVDTRGIVARALAAGRVVALPRCAGARVLAWHRVRSLDGLVASPFGMDEPVDDDATRVDPARFSRPVALVPGLAFDDRGYRLGYGGGYYDAFLAGFPGVSIGLCRRCQRVESLRALGAVEPHDAPVDLLVPPGS